MDAEVFVPAKPSASLNVRLPVERLEYVQQFYSDKEKPIEAFLEDVLAGKVKTKDGLKLSPSQLTGKLPEGGFLQEILGGPEAYTVAKERGRLGYRVGTVIKINGCFDPELSQHHNRWGVIAKIIDAYHYEVVLESDIYEKLVIRDVDVKAIIGDILHDYRGIGAERHRKEVVPLIEKALAGKIPYVHSTAPWPRMPLMQAYVVALIDHGTVHKAIRHMKRKLKVIEECYKQGLYYGDDYRYVKGMALLWLRLFSILKKRMEALERGEGRKYTLSRLHAKELSHFLDFRGVPHVVKRSSEIKGFYDVFVDDALLSYLRQKEGGVGGEV
ncbi:MAG: hypothetical protein QXS96_07035 [Candidatus Caldarchaeum sp.]